jgi:two-component system, NtrC family, response regulator AtoC
VWLEQQQWPGNIRQLEHSLERAAVLSDAAILEAHHFRPEALTSSPTTPMAETGSRTLGEAVEVAERRAIAAALVAADGSRRDAAQRLGISLRTLFYKLSQYKLE